MSVNRITSAPGSFSGANTTSRKHKGTKKPPPPSRHDSYSTGSGFVDELGGVDDLDELISLLDGAPFEEEEEELSKEELEERGPWAEELLGPELEEELGSRQHSH